MIHFISDSHQGRTQRDIFRFIHRHKGYHRSQLGNLSYSSDLNIIIDIFTRIHIYECQYEQGQCKNGTYYCAKKVSALTILF
jgi:hypothetical protein